MLFKITKVLFVVVYGIFAVEMLMRIMAAEPMLPRYVVAAPYGIRGNMPDQSYRHTTAEYQISIRTNSRGIRADREIPYEKPEGMNRIVLLGDSFGMGYGVDKEDMFTTRMVYYLEQKYSIKAEIVNLSTSGHGNAEELIVYQKEGVRYQPDLVILGWHYTDLDDNVRSGLFELKEDGTLERKAKTYLPGVKEREFLQNYAIYRYLDENSQIYNFFRNRIASKVKKILTKFRFQSAKRSQRAEDSEKVERAKIERNRYRRALSVALLKKIRNVCHESGAGFMILDIPVRLSRTEFISRFPLGDETSRENFNIVSPISRFQEKSGEMIYWEKSNGHFTPLGCDMVGELLADYICQHHLLPRNGLSGGQRQDHRLQRKSLAEKAGYLERAGYPERAGYHR